jgi:hypothetical protein
MPRDEARSTPPRAGPLSFLAPESRKTFDLNHALKVTLVDLVTVFVWCRLWLGLLPGHTSRGLSEGGNPRGRVPALPYVRSQQPAPLYPLHAAGRSLREESGRGNVDSSAKPEEHTLESSGRIVLECGCGERLMLLGLEVDWRSEQRIEFECSCGNGLTFSDRLNEDVLEFRRLMRGTLKSRAVDVGDL